MAWERVKAGALSCLLFSWLLLWTAIPALAAQPSQPSSPAPASRTAIPLLQRIVLTPDEKLPSDSDLAGPPGIDSTRLPTLPPRIVDTLQSKFLGRPLSPRLAEAVRLAVQDGYESATRPFVNVTIPLQAGPAGVLEVVVSEHRLGRIRVEGNVWFDKAQYSNAIRIRPGDPIDTTTLYADTNWLNRNTYRHADLLVAKGAQSTDDVIIRVRDKLPLTFQFGADNTGTPTTSLYRLSTTINWGNAFWRGDNLAYTFIASPDFNKLREHVLIYTADLPWRDTLSLTGVIADSHGDPVGEFSTDGHTDILSLRYTTALPSSARFVQHLSFGFDYKSTNTNTLSGGGAVFPTTSEIDQFVGEYGGQLADRLGITGVLLDVVGSPGEMSPMNTNAAFAVQQPGASANYVYGRLTIDRLTKLPWQLSLSTRLTAQLSDAVLLPSEQLPFGGVQSVRGFVDYGATRDEGVLLQTELRAPAFHTSLPQLLHLGGGEDAIVPFLFVDAGVGGNHMAVAGMPDSWLELISIGPGVTWQFARYGALRFTWGSALVRRGQTGPLLGPQFGVQIVF